MGRIEEVIFTSLILLSFFLSLQTMAVDLEGLGLLLSFDEGSGDVAQDSSGNGNDGDIEGAKWVEGKIGVLWSLTV